MPSSDEHLQQLAGRRRDDGPRPPRRWLTVLLVLVPAITAGLVWRALSSSTTTDLSVTAVGDGIMAWWLDRQSDQLLAPSDSDTPVAFEVAPGETLPAVAKRLEANGLVRSADAFRLLARVRGLDRQVQAGEHVLRGNMVAGEILEELLTARGPAVRVTVPEGLRAEEIAKLLATRGLVDQSEFLRLVGLGRSDHSTLADRPVGAGLEGYLFPDTYEFAPDAGAEAVVTRMLDTFEARVSPPEVRALVVGSGRTLYEVVTLASIVEREAMVAAERGRIARVYLNRLAEPPFILNADPTVQYALGFQPEEDGWWKRWLTEEDLAIDSAFNTYKYAGLPPGPIANPGLAAILAVLEAEDGDWLYFVANDLACDGTHVFATTWDEHLANVATYRTGGCGSD